MNKRIVTFSVAMVLLLGITLGVTFALMNASTQTITNTFVVGGFGELDIWETVDGSLVNAGVTAQDGENYQVYPGAVFTKDPYVTFDTDGAAGEYYLFIKLEGTNANTAGEWIFNDNSVAFKIGEDSESGEDINLLDFSIVENGTVGDAKIGWIPLYDGDGVQVPGVYYQVFNDGEDAPYATPGTDEDPRGQIIVDDTVTVPADLNYENIQAVDDLAGSSLELAFSAYAVQKVDDTSAFAAWDEYFA